MRLGLGTNVFHQTIIVVGPLLLLSTEKDEVNEISNESLQTLQSPIQPFYFLFLMSLVSTSPKLVLSICLQAELIPLSVPVISAQSVWLSSLQTAPSFQSPPSFSLPQPESRASARSLYVVFAVEKKAEDIERQD